MKKIKVILKDGNEVDIKANNVIPIPFLIGSPPMFQYNDDNHTCVALFDQTQVVGVILLPSEN